MKRTISKQKLYEEAIMNTYEYRLGPQIEKEMEQLKCVPETFSELMLKRALFGFKDNIPRKQPFDKLGFKYLVQLMGMSAQIKDDEFLYHLFEFMNKHTEYFDFSSQEQFDICYDFYYETLTTYRSLSEKIGTFILKHFDKSLEGYDRVVTLAYNLCACDNDISITELVNLKRGKYGLEPVEDFEKTFQSVLSNENGDSTKCI